MERKRLDCYDSKGRNGRKEMRVPAKISDDLSALDSVKDGKTGKVAAPQLLRDFRHVYNNDKIRDKTRGHQKCRKYYEEFPERFFAQWTSLERSYAQRGVSSSEEKGKDEGSDRAVELAERWLKERVGNGRD